MATIDTRTAIRFTLPDDLVTSVGAGGGVDVDLSAVAFAKATEALTVQCSVAVTTAGVVYIAVPAGVSGAVTSVSAVNNDDPGGDLVITPAIGPSGGAFVAITDGDLIVANTSVAGTLTTATPTAANAVVGGASVIEVAWDNGAATACVVTVTLLITRA